VLNSVLIGRLCADPEIKKVGENSVCIFTLAVDRPFKNKEGKNEVDFIQVVCWRKQAEVVAKFCFKGMLVAVEGRLQIRKYEIDGQKRTAAEVVADRVVFLSRKEDKKSDDDRGQTEAAAASLGKDDLPF